MKIFFTGATGFIGGHLARALAARGHELLCLARGAAAARLEAAALPGVRVLRGDFTRPETWTAAVAGHDAAVNTVGIIRETPGATFDAVHTAAPVALFEAAARAGARKIVQLSALGADAGAASRYHLSKRAADERLAALGAPSVVLRPSFVYGAGDHSMTFFASLAALPLSPVPGDGRFLLQPIHVDDLVRALVAAIEKDDLRDFAVDVGGARAVTFDELLDVLAHRLGKPRGARKLHVPWPAMRLAAAATDALGGRGPITREELSMLRRGNSCDNAEFVRRFGFEPAPIEAGLARDPPSPTGARLASVRLPLRLSVAFIWIATAIICTFIYPVAASCDLLVRVGIPAAAAPAVLYATNAFELALGGLMAAGWRVRLLCAIQVALVLGFTAILTVAMPGLWAEPFGPLTKNVPLLGATIAAWALAD